jgi:hypothetical protein
MPTRKLDVIYGTLDLLVLKTLEALGPLHGYAVARRLHQVSQELLQLNQGTLYPALLRLEHNGWISSGLGHQRQKVQTDRGYLHRQRGSDLQFHHLTEQLPFTIAVVTTRSRKNRKIEFRNSKIEFSRVAPSRFFGYDKIAFSYGASYYNEVSSHPNKTLGKALGRIQVISKLKEWNIINNRDKIHLLGCSVPQEFGWYKDLPYIESLDTSNPVMAGVEGIEYSKNGLYIKPTSNMNTVFENKKLNVDLIKYNVAMF